MATKKLLQTQQPDISDLLKKTPNELELLNLLADFSDLWHEIGSSLNVSHDTLGDLMSSAMKCKCKLIQVIHSWLSTTESHLVTWETVIDAIKSPIVNNKKIATEIYQHLTKVKEDALQRFIKDISQSEINPVEVSQLLFSKRCVSEETLDKIETLEGTLDEKKTTLLSAIHTEISSDHKKLNVVATVLSEFEKTKHLSEKIINEYDDQTTSNAVQEAAMISHNTHEDHASDILRCHYGTLSQSLQYPVRIAQYLFEEGVITKTSLKIIKSTAKSPSTRKVLFVLLQAVRRAVHTNYHNLEGFATVLLKQTSNVPCAKAILQDYRKAFLNYDTQVANADSESSQTSDKILKPIPIPRKLDSSFGLIRKEFGIAFSKIREAINKSAPPLNALTCFFADSYPHLKSEITHSKSIDDVLDVVRDHCTLINISCLEGIVERFNIKEAETHIQEYKDFVQSFCKKTNASLCLNQTFKENKSHSLLKCETAIFVLDWDPTNYTLEDIEDIIAESVEDNVQIRVIREGQSIIVTCFFPLCLTTSIIAKAQETLESVKKKGLIQLIVGCCTIYDHRRDKEVKAIVEENTKELRSELEIEQTISKKMTMQISFIEKQIEEMRQMKEKEVEDLKSKLRDKDKQIETLKQTLEESVKKQNEIEKQKEIAISLMLHLGEKDEQIEELKQSLQDNYYTTEEKLFSVSKKQREIEEQQKIITSLTLQLRDKDKQNETLKQRLQEIKQIREKKIKDLTSVPKRKEDFEKEFVQKTAEGQKEIVKLQEVTTSVALQLLERDEKIEELKQTLKGDTGRVHWNDDNHSVELRSPSIVQSEDAISKLIKEEQTGKEWSISLYSSPPESTAVVINNLNKCAVRRLDIWDTSFDSKCVSVLSDTLQTNITMKRLVLESSSLTGGIKQVCDSLCDNKTLEQLVLWHVTGITDEDMTHLSNMLERNITLKELRLYNCNITDNGVQCICEGLTKNQTLTKLNIGCNRQITSVSTSAIADLIQTNASLIKLYLYDTSLKNDDIKTICTSLTENTTIKELYLASQHEECCKQLDSYQVIKDKLVFSSF